MRAILFTLLSVALHGSARSHRVQVGGREWRHPLQRSAARECGEGEVAQPQTYYGTEDQPPAQASAGGAAQARASLQQLRGSSAGKRRHVSERDTSVPVPRWSTRCAAWRPGRSAARRAASCRASRRAAAPSRSTGRPRHTLAAGDGSGRRRHRLSASPRRDVHRPQPSVLTDPNVNTDTFRSLADATASRSRRTRGAPRGTLNLNLPVRALALRSDGSARCAVDRHHHARRAVVRDLRQRRRAGPARIQSEQGARPSLRRFSAGLERAHRPAAPRSRYRRRLRGS